MLVPPKRRMPKLRPQYNFPFERMQLYKILVYFFPPAKFQSFLLSSPYYFPPYFLQDSQKSDVTSNLYLKKYFNKTLTSRKSHQPIL